MQCPAESKNIPSARVFCRLAEDRSVCFWWPWQQPIGSVDDLDAVAGKIADVLLAVEGQP